QERGQRVDRAAGLGAQGQRDQGQYDPPGLREDRHEPHRRRAARRARRARRRTHQRAAGAGGRGRAQRRLLLSRGVAAMVSRLAITALAAALLSACAVGPDHVRPHLAVPERFGSGEPALQSVAGGGEATAATGTRAPAHFDDAFLQGLGDPLLAQLVDEALHANHDLRITLARLAQANALLRVTRFDALPTSTAQGEAADVRSSADQAPGVPRAARDGEQWSAGIAAGWELDLFGHGRRGIEAGRAEADASEADLRAVQVAVAGEMARTYIELRGSQERLRVARANRDNQQRTFDL